MLVSEEGSEWPVAIRGLTVKSGRTISYFLATVVELSILLLSVASGYTRSIREFFISLPKPTPRDQVSLVVFPWYSTPSPIHEFPHGPLIWNLMSSA